MISKFARFGLALVILASSARIFAQEANPQINGGAIKTHGKAKPMDEPQTIPLFQTSVTLDAGEYFDNKDMEYRFRLSNPKEGLVSNLLIEPSCGCTVVDLPGNAIGTRQNMEINVSMDPLGKKGKIKKTLLITYTHDNEQHEMNVVLWLKVVADVKGHVSGSLGKKIFGPKCGKCHADPANGKHGEDLFKAVCGFCHGKNAEGGVGRSFNDLRYLRTFDPEKAGQVISDGVGGDEMPGFAIENGGPLDDSQIKSLVSFIRQKRVRWKKFID